MWKWGCAGGRGRMLMKGCGKKEEKIVELVSEATIHSVLARIAGRGIPWFRIIK